MMDLACPLPQSEAFERTCRSIGVDVARYETSDGTCLVQSRKLPVLGDFHLVSRGPVAETNAGFETLTRDICRNLKGIMVVNAPAGDAKTGGMKFAKGAELAILDLAAPTEMRAGLQQKWRNQLNKAESAALEIRVEPLDLKKHHWFLEAETKQQSARGYKSYPSGFLLAYAAANKNQAMLYSARIVGRPVAGMLVLKHGAMATYQAGVTTPDGRKYCAHNRLLWTMMCDLQSEGTVRLDLGRADLSSGLKRFKRGCGAHIETLSGSFLFHHWFSPRQRGLRVNAPQAPV
ncbi:MAG: GNAT family N-acetyltransferase [Pseudomonadota bacterium]